jgi:hypothetical protein
MFIYYANIINSIVKTCIPLGATNLEKLRSHASVWSATKRAFILSIFRDIDLYMFSVAFALFFSLNISDSLLLFFVKKQSYCVTHSFDDLIKSQKWRSERIEWLNKWSQTESTPFPTKYLNYWRVTNNPKRLRSNDF